MSDPLHIHEEVVDALHGNRGVVLLETAVLTCGLPCEVWQKAHGDCPTTIDRSLPVHLATMRGMMEAIRAAGCVPAVTAVLSGTPRVGLSDDELVSLADDRSAGKASTATMAAVLATGCSAGTTVSGTLRLSAAVAAAGLPQPRIFATGGIGGVHAGWPARLDVSADLGELARQQVCVVCAGAKSIIDAHSTCEVLEAMGVPVLGYRLDRMPGFQCPPSAGSPAVHRVESASDAGAVAHAHWSLPGSGGLLLCQSPPPETAMPVADVDAAAAEAERIVEAGGPARTPALLNAMATVSCGATLRANIDLLLANARLAGELAAVMAAR